MRDETVLRASAIWAGVTILVTSCITGLDGTLHLLAGLLIAFGIKLSAASLKRYLGK